MQTLEQWLAAAPIQGSFHKSGAYVVPCAYLDPDKYRGLWNLSDFRVSSVSAGSAWLVRKQSK